MADRLNKFQGVAPFQSFPNFFIRVFFSIHFNKNYDKNYRMTRNNAFLNKYFVCIYLNKNFSYLEKFCQHLPINYLAKNKTDNKHRIFKTYGNLHIYWKKK